MRKSLIDFLIDNKVDISINEKRLIPDISHDFDLQSLLIPIVIIAEGKRTDRGLTINRTLLKLLTYLLLNPDDFDELSTLALTSSLSLFEKTNHLGNFRRYWDYFETSYRILKLTKHVEDPNENVCTLTPKGEIFINSILEKHKGSSFFQRQFQLLDDYRKSGFTQKELGIT